MKKNILFSTTRQWNPGDEFILHGSINLLNDIIGDFNPIIYNRNPDIRKYSNINPFRKSKYCKFLEKGKHRLDAIFRLGFWDNSFKDEMDLNFIDMVVFAGSPEWIESNLLPLYKKLKDFQGKILYLGIGSGRNINLQNISFIYKNVIKKADLITVRDLRTYLLLKDFNPHFLPCPALFSVPLGLEKEINKIRKIGLIFSTYRSVPFNKVNKETYDFLMQLYKNLIDLFDCEIVCHYIDELPEAYEIFNVPIHYSYDSRDYVKIYKRFDLVIGPRVHGIGISASMGIPGFLISHDLRGDTGKGFLSEIITIKSDINSVIDKLHFYSYHINKINRNLISYKKIKYYEFKKIIEPVVS